MTDNNNKKNEPILIPADKVRLSPKVRIYGTGDLFAFKTGQQSNALQKKINRKRSENHD